VLYLGVKVFQKKLFAWLFFRLTFFTLPYLSCRAGSPTPLSALSTIPAVLMIADERDHV